MKEKLSRNVSYKKKQISKPYFTYGERFTYKKRKQFKSFGSLVNINGKRENINRSLFKSQLIVFTRC